MTSNELFIVDKHCVVHREPGLCYAGRTMKHLPVTRNQCMVYHLASCGQCFPDHKVYDKLVMQPRGIG